MRTVYRFKLDAVMNNVNLPAGATVLAATFNGKLGGLPKDFNADEATPEKIEDAKMKVIPVVDLFVMVPDSTAAETPRTFLNVPVGQALPEGKELVFAGIASFPQKPARMVFEMIDAKPSKKSK